MDLIRQIVELAVKHRIPAVYELREYVDRAGCVRRPSLIGLSRRVAFLWIGFSRAQAAALPSEQPTQLEMVINLKAAAGLGLTSRKPSPARADHVVH